jgi:hypothetical protein
MDRNLRSHLHFFTPHRIQAVVLSREEMTVFLQQLNPAYQPKSYEWSALRAAFLEARRLQAAEITGETSNFAWLEGLFSETTKNAT